MEFLSKENSQYYHWLPIFSRSDVTFDIYTTVTKELKQAEFDDFQKKLKEKKQEWKNRQEKDA